MSSDNKFSGISVSCPECAIALHVGVLPTPLMTEFGEGWWFECGQCGHRWWYKSLGAVDYASREENIEKLRRIMSEFDDQYQHGPQILDQEQHTEAQDSRGANGNNPFCEHGAPEQTSLPNGSSAQMPQLNRVPSQTPEPSAVSQTPHLNSVPRAPQLNTGPVLSQDDSFDELGFNEVQLELILRDPRNKEIFEGKVGSDFFPKKKWVRKSKKNNTSDQEADVDSPEGIYVHQNAIEGKSQFPSNTFHNKTGVSPSEGPVRIGSTDAPRLVGLMGSTDVPRPVSSAVPRAYIGNTEPPKLVQQESVPSSPELATRTSSTSVEQRPDENAHKYSYRRVLPQEYSHKPERIIPKEKSANFFSNLFFTKRNPQRISEGASASLRSSFAAEGGPRISSDADVYQGTQSKSSNEIMNNNHYSSKDLSTIQAPGLRYNTPINEKGALGQKREDPANAYVPNLRSNTLTNEKGASGQKREDLANTYVPNLRSNTSTNEKGSSCQNFDIITEVPVEKIRKFREDEYAGKGKVKHRKFLVRFSKGGTRMHQSNEQNMNDGADIDSTEEVVDNESNVVELFGGTKYIKDPESVSSGQLNLLNGPISEYGEHSALGRNDPKGKGRWRFFKRKAQKKHSLNKFDAQCENAESYSDISGKSPDKSCLELVVDNNTSVVSQTAHQGSSNAYSQDSGDSAQLLPSSMKFSASPEPSKEQAPSSLEDTSNISCFAISENGKAPIVIPFQKEVGDRKILPPLMPDYQEFHPNTVKIPVIKEEHQVIPKQKKTRNVRAWFISSIVGFTISAAYVSYKHRDEALSLWQSVGGSYKVPSAAEQLALEHVSYTLVADKGMTRKIIIVGEIVNHKDYSLNASPLKIRIYSAESSKLLTSWTYLHSSLQVLPSEHSLFRMEKLLRLNPDEDIRVEVSFIQNNDA
ncbi:MAG: hypothetical protein LBQ43_03120 [Holosporales bacterium]|jgi:hypothetical protein|nr:hypothetical protein [Holosporales bacterium]